MTSSDSPIKTVSGCPVNEFLKTGQESLKLKVVAGTPGLRAVIRDKTLNRPALALTGYWKYFGNKRIQLFGAGEMAYLRDLKKENQMTVLKEMARRKVPCIIISRNLAPTRTMYKLAEEKKLPLIRTCMNTRDFAATATLVLEELFAPSTVEHGTMMDIKGIGTLIKGSSGIGKSECALHLIDQGYSLIADDAVHIKLLNERELMATSNELNRNYMECRGMGIINIADLFGIGATQLKKPIQLVITLKEWAPGMVEDRTGLEENFYELLGQAIPHIIIPVRPGRNIAQLVEVAAMVQALKIAGYNPAQKFNERLISHLAKEKKAVQHTPSKFLAKEFDC